jgi:stage II sporulation protein D
MRKSLLTLLALLQALFILASNDLRVGIYAQSNISRFTFTTVKGTYSVQADSRNLFQIKPGETVDISVASGELRVIFKGASQGAFAKVRLAAIGPAEFKVLPAGQKPNSRIYEEELETYLALGKLTLVNVIDAEKYVPGVIEAEGGSKHQLEYYKVQAIISRTYGYNNMRRHEAEGFHVCDATHCQVFHGKARHEPLAYKATEATTDIVIVDDNIDLITAAFHSNCGGHTINAEEVWSKPLSYCIGKPDTFCLVMPHSNWEKTIDLHHWNKYLESKRYNTSDTSSLAYGFFPSEKQCFLVDSTHKIPLRTMREDLKLRSTFFTIHQDGEQIRFIGQGFGHGVGLCQEGAMRMAQLGYTYKEIIHYYYTGVHLVPRHMMWFFKDDF